MTRIERMMRVSTTMPSGQESDIEESLGLVEFEGTPASVAVNLSRTVNLGNYESAKMGVIVTLPCAPTEIEEAYDMALRFASDKLSELVEKCQR